MERIISMLNCDLCGSEKNVHKKLYVPAYRTFDGTDGCSYYDEPRIEFVTCDLCEECLKKITAIQDIGVQRMKLIYNPIEGDKDEA